MDNYCNEKYSQLYLQYKKLYESMLKSKKCNFPENMTLTELSIIVKLKYPDKANAINMANNLFYERTSLENLGELLELYENIKE